MTIFIWLVVLAAVGAGGYFAYAHFTAAPERAYRAAPVKKGGLVSTISSTGTVEPEEVIDIGAQVAGVIEKFGVDKKGKLIDYRSEVEADMILAQIDAALYKADLDTAISQVAIDKAGVLKAQADLETAKAKLEQAKSDLLQFKAKLDQAKSDLDQFKAKLDQSQADVAQAQAKYEQAQRDWDRAQKIGPSDALSQQDFDAFKGVYEAAKASYSSFKFIAMQTQHNIESQKAVITQAEANIASQQSVILQSAASIHSSEAIVAQTIETVHHDEAVRDKAQTNVNYCTIKSPVKGVIVDRRVNIGQTVVSSLSAPSLFLLAKDLTKMQVWASVNEADLGHIFPGQKVTFTIDAFPGQIFIGNVIKVRLNATMTQNVVTYTVEIGTDNSKGTLIPYMTANTLFEVARRDDVLMVPNAALRYVPKPDEIAPDVVPDDEKSGRGSHRSGTETTGAATTEKPARDANAKTEAEESSKPDEASSKSGARPKMTRGKLWIKDGLFLRPIRVRTGISDGTNTEVKGEDLKEDMQVIIGRQALAADTGGNAAAPFVPQMGRPRGTQTSQTK